WGLSNPREITIVTLYVNIGAFPKGKNKIFTAETYKTWMGSWAMLTNRVIGFFDDDQIMEYFRKIRSLQPKDRTFLTKVNRSELSSFKHLERVRQLFSDPSYPKHNPNTVIPEYACAMSAKYDALDKAMATGLIQSKYVAWMDIGLFRKLGSAGYIFTLEVPPNVNSSCVSMTEVSQKDQMSKVTPRDYIWSNRVWVAGGFVLATTEVMEKFSKSYKNMVQILLDQNLTSTDQQIIGAMYSPDYIHQQPVNINAYRCKDGQFGLHGADRDYFCLPYICKETGENRRKETVSV
ncbi:unnamed protein product, partial [Candidula unifasciata]